MKKLVILAVIIGVLFSTISVLAMTGQERAGLVRSIQVSVQAKTISGEEANALNNLIALDKGYPQLLQDYVQKYKKAGKTLDEFYNDVYTDKVP
jgi:hypothetical protein